MDQLHFDSSGSNVGSESIRTFSPRSEASNPMTDEEPTVIVLPVPLNIDVQQTMSVLDEPLTANFWRAHLEVQANYHLPVLNIDPLVHDNGASALEVFHSLEVFYKTRTHQSALITLFISYMTGQEYKSLGFTLASHQGVRVDSEQTVLEAQFPSKRQEMTDEDWKAFLKAKKRGIKKHLFVFEMAVSHGMDVFFFKHPRKRAPSLWK